MNASLQGATAAYVLLFQKKLVSSSISFKSDVYKLNES